MKLKILKIVDDQIRFLDKHGNMKIEPNTPYFQVKLLQFDGRRISHTFADGINVKETFNEMIFNAEYRGDITQIRPNYADKVCSAILEHQETGNYEMFDKIFQANYSVIYNTKLIQSVIRQYGDRVKVTEDGFVIDDMFLVDRNGAAWIWQNNQKIKKGRGAGNSLCLVVNKLPPERNGINTLYDKSTITVLAKIFFLLNPVMTDHVFTGQLPNEIKEILLRNEIKR